MILFTIIGALIGAGFASGQEIYLFFYRFGKNGIIGIFLCSLIISCTIYKTLKIIHSQNINSYKEFLEYIFVNKTRLCTITNTIINIFLCISFFIMVAGFGTYLNQQFGINKFIGSFIIAIISYLVFCRNIESITKINSIIVPILILIILTIGVKNLFSININHIGLNTPKDNTISWVIQAIIYSSYNLILLIPVLINLKKFIRNKGQIIFISVATGIIILIISILTFLLLVNVNTSFSNLEMPIVYVIEHKFIEFRYIYGIIILIAIFTTAISVGISFLNNICEKSKLFPQIAGIMCITSVAVSGVGFSNLVKILFPVFGYLGIIQIIYIFK